MAYETTSVPVERSQGEIRKLLTGHGVLQLSFGEDWVDDVRWAAVAFTHHALVVRMRVPLKPPPDGEVLKKLQRNRSGKSRRDVELALYEQEEKRVWRVLAWGLKARLVAVEEEVETFEQAFLPHLVNPDTGMTVYEELASTGRVQLPDALPQLTAGIPDAEVVP